MDKKVTLLPEQVEALKQELMDLYNRLKELQQYKGDIKEVTGCDNYVNSIATNCDSSLLMEINIVATRIKEVKNVLDTADILDNVENDSNVITIGSKFTVDTDSVKNLTFTLVEIGGDPLEGLVSLDSPIGAAVINKSVGESFSYLTPSQQQINGCIKAILTLEDNIDDKKQYVATKK